MPDTRRSLAALQAVLADNTTGAISEQDIRDFLVSCAPPYASCYISASAETSIAGADTWTKVAGTTTSRHLKEFTMPADNRLTYTGTPDIHVHVVASLSMTSASNNQTIGFRIVRNGDETEADSVASEVRRRVGTGTDVGSTAIHADFVLSTNDYIEVWAENETSAGNVTLTQMYFFAMGMFV